jgi:hypothetical protein
MEESDANTAYPRGRSRGRPRGKPRGRPRGRPRRAQSNSTVKVNHSLSGLPQSNLPHSRGSCTQSQLPRALTPKEEAAEKLLADIIAKVENANAFGGAGLYQIWSEFSVNDENCLPGLEKIRRKVSIKKTVSATNSEVEWTFYNSNPWV